MFHPISIFIMDVRNSTSSNWEEISEYLKKLVKWINNWTGDVTKIKLKHRLGDEIILIGENYSTAYIIAFYVHLIWKFSNYPPYFGVTFGDIDKDLDSIDLDTWNHPLVKKARIANETLKIKEELKNDPLKFPINLQFSEDYFLGDSLIQFLHKNFFKRDSDVNVIKELLSISNNTINYVFAKQKSKQKLITILYLIYNKQKDIAKELNLSEATISYHIKKGDVRLVCDIFNNLLRIFDILQRSDNINVYNSEALIKNINNSLKENFHILFMDERLK